MRFSELVSPCKFGHRKEDSLGRCWAPSVPTMNFRLSSTGMSGVTSGEARTSTDSLSEESPSTCSLRMESPSPSRRTLSARYSRPILCGGCLCPTCWSLLHLSLNPGANGRGAFPRCTRGAKTIDSGGAYPSPSCDCNTIRSYGGSGSHISVLLIKACIERIESGSDAVT